MTDLHFYHLIEQPISGTDGTLLWAVSDRVENPDSDLIVYAPDHGTLVYNEEEYTVLRVTPTGSRATRSSFVFTTSGNPDRLRRILCQE